MNIPYVFRRCTKCGEWLVASSVNFSKKKGGKYGLRADCKECRSKYNKEYYKINEEAIKEQNKKYNETHKEAKAERSKKYREQNKEAIAERMKKYYEENKEALAKQHKEYRKTPQGQVVAFNKRNRRRAKEQNQGRGITKDQWLEMMNFFGWECAYSGKYLGGNTKDRTIDHIDPLNNGGENEIWNCIPMDKSLNSSKKDREMLNWYVKQEFCTAERLLKIYKWQEYARNKYDNSIVNE